MVRKLIILRVPQKIYCFYSYSEIIDATLKNFCNSIFQTCLYIKYFKINNLKLHLIFIFFNILIIA